jgi:hypothetical protein
MDIQIDLIFETTHAANRQGSSGLRAALGRRRRRVDPTSN